MRGIRWQSRRHPVVSPRLHRESLSVRPYDLRTLQPKTFHDDRLNRDINITYASHAATDRDSGIVIVAAGPSVSSGAAPVTLREVDALASQLANLLARLDPTDIPASTAPKLWARFDRISRLGRAGTMLLAQKVDESGVWKREGCRSGHEWRARESGSSMGDAKRQGRASEQLKGLGDTADALRRGELSADQAEAISDAASVNPDAERKLLGDAQEKSLKDLRDDCAKARAAGDRDPDGTQRRIRAERRLSIYGRPDGSSGLSANDFLKKTSMIQVDRRGLANLAPDIRRLADVEGLSAHRYSVDIRLEDPEPDLHG